MLFFHNGINGTCTNIEYVSPDAKAIIIGYEIQKMLNKLYIDIDDILVIRESSGEKCLGNSNIDISKETFILSIGTDKNNLYEIYAKDKDVYADIAKYYNYKEKKIIGTLKKD